MGIAVVVGDALDVPAGRDDAEVDVGDLGAAVHLPQHGGAVVVAPDDVGRVIAVVVAGALDVPVGGDGVEIDVGELLVVLAHLPQHGGAVVVAPQDVGPAVAVEVAD